MACLKNRQTCKPCSGSCQICRTYKKCDFTAAAGATVTVAGAGGFSATATTDGSGNACITVPGSGTYTVTVTIGGALISSTTLVVTCPAGSTGELDGVAGAGQQCCGGEIVATISSLYYTDYIPDGTPCALSPGAHTITETMTPQGSCVWGFTDVATTTLTYLGGGNFRVDRPGSGFPPVYLTGDIGAINLTWTETADFGGGPCTNVYTITA